MENCPYCGHEGELYIRIHSRVFCRCDGCGLIYRDWSDPEIDILAYYRKDYYDGHAADQVGGGRCRLYEHILDLIENRVGVGRLLDVGTGCGYFLAAARKRGWVAKGVEPSSQSVAFARAEHGLDVFEGVLDQYDDAGGFDAVTFINVLDHSARPWLEIGRAADLLRPAGLLFLRFPSGVFHASLLRLASLFGLDERFGKYLVFHRHAFTPRFIARLMADYGFTEVRISNSLTTDGDPDKLFRRELFTKCVKCCLNIMAGVVDVLSHGGILLGSSLNVVAVKGARSDAINRQSQRY